MTLSRPRPALQYAPVEGHLNLARVVLGDAAAHPRTADRPALTFIDGRGDPTWTYRELWDWVSAIGRGLLASGLTPGERVLVRLAHSPAYAAAFFGAVAAGLVPIPASPLLTESEARFLADDSEAAAVVTSPELRVGGFRGLEIFSDRLAALDGPGPLPDTRAEEPAYLIYTSGTGARPKGVLHAHRSILGRLFMLEAWEGFGPGDRTLHAGTLNWSYTLGVGLMDPWLVGAHAMLFGGSRDPAAWPAIIAERRISVFAAVPTVFRQILKYGRPEAADLSLLRHGLCAGEPLHPAILQEWRQRAGTDLYEALGMT
ncbi:MAG TPA: AMP-binding protein, partial [Dehalococcoidia bacterium]|nr:AMP-binding protein [Dehalococcoidia bacterium]